MEENTMRRHTRSWTRKHAISENQENDLFSTSKMKKKEPRNLNIFNSSPLPGLQIRNSNPMTPFRSHRVTTTLLEKNNNMQAVTSSKAQHKRKTDDSKKEIKRDHPTTLKSTSGSPFLTTNTRPKASTTKFGLISPVRGILSSAKKEKRFEIFNDILRDEKEDEMPVNEELTMETNTTNEDIHELDDDDKENAGSIEAEIGNPPQPSTSSQATPAPSVEGSPSPSKPELLDPEAHGPLPKYARVPFGERSIEEFPGYFESTSSSKQTLKKVWKPLNDKDVSVSNDQSKPSPSNIYKFDKNIVKNGGNQVMIKSATWNCSLDKVLSPPNPIDTQNLVTSSLFTPPRASSSTGSRHEKQAFSFRYSNVSSFALRTKLQYMKQRSKSMDSGNLNELDAISSEAGQKNAFKTLKGT